MFSMLHNMFLSNLYFYEEEAAIVNRSSHTALTMRQENLLPACSLAITIILQNVTTCHHLIPLVNDQVMTILEAQTLLLTDIEYAS